MWHDFWQWLGRPTGQATIATVVAVSLAVIVYLVICRRIRSKERLAAATARTTMGKVIPERKVGRSSTPADRANLTLITAAQSNPASRWSSWNRAGSSANWVRP